MVEIELTFPYTNMKQGLSNILASSESFKEALPVQTFALLRDLLFAAM